MAMFSGNALSLKKRHCHWNKDFNGLCSQKKQGIQDRSPSPLPASHLCPLLGGGVGGGDGVGEGWYLLVHVVQAQIWTFHPLHSLESLFMCPCGNFPPIKVTV